MTPQLFHDPPYSEENDSPLNTRILLTLLTFFALPILKKKNTNLSGTVSLWYESWC